MAAQRGPAFRRIIGGKPSLVFYLLFGALAALCIGVGYHTLRTARQSLDWPSTSGEIVHAEVEEHVSVNRDKDGKRTSTDITYASNVVYEFRVAAQNYQGHRVRFDWETTRAEAEATVAKYRVGTNMSVYYDPADPSNAVLEPGGDVFTFEVLIGLGFFFLFVIAAYIAVRALLLLKRPGLRIEIDPNMSGRVSQAKGLRAKWAACNWMQRTAVVISVPILGAALSGWIAGSLWLILLGVDGYLHPDGPQLWPSTSALVVVSEMKPLLVKKTDTGHRGAVYNRYDLDIAVEYRVAGNRYSLQVRRGVVDDEQVARALLARFLKGSYVDVYYKRSDPADAQLTPHEPAGLGLAALGAIMLAPWLGAGLVLAGVWLKGRLLLPLRRAGAARRSLPAKPS
jgi:Protein of unknown function (DUF3592)